MATETTKIGAIIGLLGSIILLIVGLFGISFDRSLSHPDPNYPAFLPYIIGGVTIALSAFGLFGTILVFRDNNIGYTILIVAGIVGIICKFIPIYIYDTGWGYIDTSYLSNALLYVDLDLMVVGGILGFTLVEKKERFVRLTAIETTKIGAIIGLLGSIILLMMGLSGISLSLLFNSDPKYPAFLPYITGGVTIAFSVFGLFGARLVFRDYNIGYTILLVAGIVGIIGTFTPICIYDTGWGSIGTYYLSNTLQYVDLVLMVVGGILGFALAEKEERFVKLTAIETTKIGAIIGLLGSIILLIVGLSTIGLSRYGFNSDPNYSVFLSYIIGGVTLALSAFGLFGAILVFRDNNIGYTILLIAGIVGIICSFTPIYIYATEWGSIRTYYLGNTLLYVDLVLMVVGGILGLALAEKKERKE